MVRIFSIVMALVAVLIVCASVGYRSDDGVAQQGKAGRVDEATVVPRILIDSVKDAVEWNSKPALPSKQELKDDAIEFRRNDNMNVVIELINSRDGKITVDRRQWGGWHAGLYRNGKRLDDIIICLTEPKPKDLVTIEPGDSAEFPLELGPAISSVPGRYQLLISFFNLRSNTFGQSPRRLQKRVEVIVKGNSDLR